MVWRSRSNASDVAVEKYLAGQVVDMGGAQKANIHLKQDCLREQVENRLCHDVLLRVRAERHYQTGELRNIHWISFLDHQPSYDEEARDRFAAEGMKATGMTPTAYHG
jgi:hypothetical protein